MGQALIKWYWKKFWENRVLFRLKWPRRFYQRKHAQIQLSEGGMGFRQLGRGHLGRELSEQKQRGSHCEQMSLTGKQQERGLERASWENLVFVYQFKDLEHKPWRRWRFLSWKTEWSNWGCTSSISYCSIKSLYAPLLGVSDLFSFHCTHPAKESKLNKCNHLLSRPLDLILAQIGWSTQNNAT